MSNDEQTTRRVILRNTHLIAVGPYSRDIEYNVPADTAAHLVAHRGFDYADAPTERIEENS